MQNSNSNAGAAADSSTTAEVTTSSQTIAKHRVVGIPNRSIKFRLWDSLKKEMFFEGFHVFGEVTMFNAIGTHAYETKGEKSSLERYNDFEIMQFTGLKDCKGKDIYEGDIYRTWYSRDTTGKDIVEVIEKVEIEDNTAGQIGYEILFFHNAEVIGNVFQNTELLG